MTVRVSRAESLSLMEKLTRMNWPLFVLMCVVLTLSVLTLYSIGVKPCADGASCAYEFGSLSPWAGPQLLRIGFALIAFWAATLVNIKLLIRSSYILFGIAFILILTVSFWGHTGMGAQRWINLGIMHLQPSELIKIAIILALARYFSWLNSVEVTQFKNYIIPFLMFAFSFLMIVRQPDLGTALSLMMITAGMFFIIGMPRIWFVVALCASLVAAPLVWNFGMHDYQRSRVLTFLNPSADVRGKGYQINQSKITIGSGGLVGKGFMSSSQASLNFLPEKQTDFIFAVFGEEFGFLGCMILIAIYLAITAMIISVSRNSRNRFGQLLCFGFGLSFFVYYFVNISMVIGIMPIVGVPLPLMSFGGSSLIALLFGFGLVQNAHIHRDMQLSSKGN
ncbi:MAG: rod shape-determining protein RodA [Alphaproteobacteria bacterium]|nr:rod shape-determining protein RodA [Alphaproteobacteria bacterium]